MPTPYRFTGQRLDTGTGLYYYGARYYDAALGRFISADTIVPGAGSPQALNRYAYVYNNPLRYTDPSGHMVECGYNGESHCGAGAGPATPVVTYDTANELGLDNAWAVTGGVVDFLPGLGDAKGLAEVFTGRDLATGEDLGAWRWFGLVGMSELRNVRKGSAIAKGALKETVAALPKQTHHLLTVEHSKWTPQMAKLVGEYGLALKAGWNQLDIPHSGRHAEAYHKWAWEQIETIDTLAAGDRDRFLSLFDQMVRLPVLQAPEMVRKGFWQ